MNACAYCGAVGVKLTHEHVFNDFLPHGQHMIVDRASGSGPHRRMPTTRDVCCECNNRRLRWLDEYGAQLHRQYFAKIVPAPVYVIFEYDYPRLLGWLLKCSYNSLRSEPAPGRLDEDYGPFLPFLLGQAPPPSGLPVTLFLGIVASVPSETALERRLGPMVEPYVCTYGRLKVPPHCGAPFSIRRMVMVNSYRFFIVVWRPSVARAERRRTLTALLSPAGVTQAMYEVRSPETQIRLSEARCDARTWLYNRAMDD